MLIVYNIQSGEIVENHGTNSAFPNGRQDEEQVKIETVSKFGGTAADYGLFRLHDTEENQLIQKVYTHHYTIQNGKIVFGDEKPIQEPEPQLPTETEVLNDYIVDVDYRVIMIELGL